MQRIVHHTDAIEFLADHPRTAGASVLTSLPDVAELGCPVAEWRAWFARAATLCLDAAAPHGITFFYQTDNKHPDGWTSKAMLVLDAAQTAGVPLLWHKIVLRQPAGATVLGRPGYAHLLAFSRACRIPLPYLGPDVLPDIGDRPWSHSMGTRAARFAVETIQRHSPQTTHLLNPFCGEGTAVAVSEALGLPVVGIERNRKRAERAREMTYDPSADTCARPPDVRPASSASSAVRDARFAR